MQIIWQGQIVATLEAVEAETLLPQGLGIKEEGDFVPGDGPLAAEFQRRLEKHEALNVTINGKVYLAYARPGGRLKLSPVPLKVSPHDKGSS